MTMTGTTKKPEDWKQKLASNWFGVKIAHEALQVSKDSRRQRSVERLIKKTQDGTLGTTTEEPMDEDEDTVNVGNEINHHHYPTQSSATTAPTDRDNSKPVSSLGKNLAAFGLAAAGMGAGVALPVAAWNLTRPSESVQVTPSVDDTDTRYGLRLYKPEDSDPAKANP